MAAEAFVQDDWMRDGVKIAVRLSNAEDVREMILWGDVAVTRITEATNAMPSDDAFLHLPNDVARALYEALSRHFGGNVVDATRLRKDYDAERARVDLFIKHLTHRHEESNT